MTLNSILKLLLPFNRKVLLHKTLKGHISKLKSGLLTVITALSLLASTHGAVALSSSGAIKNVTVNFGTCRMQAIVNSTGATVRLNAGFFEVQVAGGAFFNFNDGNISNSFPAITKSFLETKCGLSHVAGLTQDGANGTYATDDNISVSFHARDLVTGDANNYYASVTRQTNSDVDATVVLVVPAPRTSFTFAPSGPIAGVQFTDTTPSAAPITQYSWNFGDGNTSSVQNPLHIYTEVGNYDVTFNLLNIDGLQHSVTQTVAVTNPIGNTVALSGLPAKINGPQTITAAFSTGISSDFSTALALSDFSVSGATLTGLSGRAIA